MGGGILPVAYHNGKVKFLFSREAMYTDDDPGKWSDFGGGKEGIGGNGLVAVARYIGDRNTVMVLC